MKNKPPNYWLVSDTHFNHARLEEWGDRSGEWQMDLWEGLMAIPAEDTLIHLGDICIGDDEAVHKGIADLKCRKVLVRGNHDKKGVAWYEAHGWDFVADGLELVYQGHYLHMTHRPARVNNNTSWNIHGHTHGNLHRSEEYVTYYDKAYHLDISPELAGYKPLRLDLLLAKKNNQNV